MANGEFADPPARSDRSERVENEASTGELGVGDRQAPRAEPATAPQSDVEIQHAWSPAATATASEFALDALQARKHDRGFEAAYDKGDGIGEITSGVTMGGVEDDGRRIEQAEFLIQPGNRCLDDSGWPARASVRAVGADGDRVEV